ncbi:hypothetical protein Y032_0005g2668 [Ancylostoma ceylanicum]|uniref:Uncharacterized protein n=1 Tax=Ancylostoma ceylanicum TaxID=53326 RepID=A0A016VTW4_9BILA|nr:hypothetical protein Y032_0005g2668 [Ancylostoma ceylanicum]
MPRAVFWSWKTWHVSLRRLANLWLMPCRQGRKPNTTGKMPTMRLFTTNRVEKQEKKINDAPKNVEIQNIA